MDIWVTEKGSGKELVLVAEDTVRNSNAWRFVKNAAGTMAVIVPVISFMGFMIVKTYGDPYVNDIIDKKAEPIVKELKKFDKELKKTTSKVSDIAFLTNQIWLILELSVADSIVSQVKEKTARFKAD